ncbi:hypothetical protein LK459_15090 [Gordonia otitidis]|uniref:hypothetical protein n=1 Tax=Gordonia otitidis TaxID=249058 RepID=UPI001D142C22|nr:hypothetical protein [Gordonia otitidis]UEA57922.1 hypothetical protein LK459_15090 [Gordonia otitidis]
MIETTRGIGVPTHAGHVRSRGSRSSGVEQQGRGARRPQRARAFLRPTVLIEAIEVEKLVVIPGLDVLLAEQQRFGLVDETSAALTQSVERHEAAVDTLIGMLIDSIGDDDSAAEQLNNAPAVLPVRALQSIVDDYCSGSDAAKVDMVRLAFLFVAVHALTDPTNCATASRNLNLVPPPLHRDRAILGRIMAHALPTFSPRDRDLFAVFVSKASAFFAVPTTHPPTPDVDGVTDLAILRYNPHALRTSCEHIGLGRGAVRVAGLG